MSTDASQTLLELTKDLLKDQADTRRLLTMKAAIMIGICSLLLSGEVPCGSLAMIGYFCAVISMICGLYVVWAKQDYTGPKLDKATKVLQEKDYEQGLMWISEANTMTCNYNAKNSNRAATALNCGIAALIVASVLLSIPPYWIEVIGSWFGGR